MEALPLTSCWKLGKLLNSVILGVSSVRRPLRGMLYGLNEIPYMKFSCYRERNWPIAPSNLLWTYRLICAKAMHPRGCSWSKTKCGKKSVADPFLEDAGCLWWMTWLEHSPLAWPKLSWNSKLLPTWFFLICSSWLFSAPFILTGFSSNKSLHVQSHLGGP